MKKLTALLLLLPVLASADPEPWMKKSDPDELAINGFADDDIPAFTHDGLQRVIDSKTAIAYVRPDADFSRYDRFMILDCYVAFKKDWQKDYNRDQVSLSGRRVTDNDMERMRRDMAELFREVFVEGLTENGGYELVDAPAVGVLLIRPAIIDLEVSAPDTRGAGRSYTFVDSTGAATLYIELYDSVNGKILARTVDRKTSSDGGKKQWANRDSNRQDAKRLLRTWAGWLRERLLSPKAVIQAPEIPE